MSCCILPQLLYLCIVLIELGLSRQRQQTHVTCRRPLYVTTPILHRVRVLVTFVVNIIFLYLIFIAPCPLSTVKCCRDLMGLHHIIHSSGELLSELWLTNWHSLECANIECKKRNSMRVAKVNRLRSRPHLLIRPSIRSDRVNIRNLFIYIVLFPMTILSTIVFTPPPFRVYIDPCYCCTT